VLEDGNFRIWQREKTHFDYSLFLLLKRFFWKFAHCYSVDLVLCLIIYLSSSFICLKRHSPTAVTSTHMKWAGQALQLLGQDAQAMGILPHRWGKMPMFSYYEYCIFTGITMAIKKSHLLCWISNLRVVHLCKNYSFTCSNVWQNRKCFNMGVLLHLPLLDAWDLLSILAVISLNA